MRVDGFDWFKFNYLTSLYSILLLTSIVLIVGTISFFVSSSFKYIQIQCLDTTNPATTVHTREICSKTKSILSLGKYKTSEISSNIGYVSRVYAHNFLAYSPHDDLLIFIEPKHQLHVYDAQTIHLIVNLTTTNVIYATSSTSLSISDRRNLFFIYESRLESSIISLRVCEVTFNKLHLNFEDKNCIKTLLIHSNKNDMHINGFAIKRNHAETEKSILFISTDIGLIYSIFNTYTGILIHEPVILNDTLNEGNIVVTPSGIVYYANKQEHTIHELRITQDFRIRYGKIIKSNAIKAPFGLMADECNHLFIATKLMIFIMSVQQYTTIRSVLSKTSYLPITIERLNSTTYVYATVKQNSEKIPSMWMLNFLSFRDPDKPVVTIRHPVVNMNTALDLHDTNTDNISERKYSSVWKLLSSITTDTTQIYTRFSSTSEISTSSNIKEETSSTDKIILNTNSHSAENLTSILSDEFQYNSSDDNLRFDNSSLPNEVHLTTQSSFNLNTFSNYVNTTINSSELLIFNNTVISNFQDKRNLSLDDDILLQTNVTQKLLSNSNLDMQYINNSTDLTKTVLLDYDLQSSFSSNIFSKYMNSTMNPLEMLESNTKDLISTNSFTTSNVIHDNIDKVSDDYTTSISNITVSTDTFNEYSKFSTTNFLFSLITQLTTNHKDKDPDKKNMQENLEINEEKSTFLSSLSNKDYIENLHSSMSTTTLLETTPIANSFDMTQSKFLSDKKSSQVDLSFDKTNDPTDRLVEDAFNINLISSTISSYEPLTIKKESFVTEYNPIHQSDENFSNSDNKEPTQLPSTVIHDNTTLLKSEYFSSISISHASSNFVLLSTPSDQSVPDINENQIHPSSSMTNDDVIISTILLDTTLLENQSYLTSTVNINNNINDGLNDEFLVVTHQSIINTENSTFFMTVTDFINKEMENEINQIHSSSIFNNANISTALHSPSPFVVSSTLPILTIDSQLSSSLHPSLSHTSTISTKFNRLSSSKYFLATTTTISVPPTMLPSSSINILQTTDSTITSDITEKSVITILAAESSSPSYTSTTSSPLPTTTDDQITSKLSSIFYDESLTSTISFLESSTIDYTTLSTTMITSINLDSTNTVQTNEYSTLRLKTTNNEENLAITDEYSEKYTSTQFSSEITSNILLDVYNSETEHSTLVVTYPPARSSRPNRRQTSELSTTSTTTSTKPKYVHRTRKRKITRWKLQTSTINADTSLVRTSTINHKFLTFSPFFIDHSNLTSLQQQQMIIIKPSISINSSNTLLSNELFNKLFNNTTNSSIEKLIYFNLLDLPPSSWNLSLNTNESIVFNIALPASSHSSNLHTTRTNLTITNVEANRLSTNIIGSPVNLQVDKIQVKQFSLAMNQTNNGTNQSLSDVVIGYVKTDRFELKLTKLDNMNMHVHQIDSETAEIYFDSQFCTNENNLEINLNLSKTGTVRYGNRTPIHIGPVFTRLHMLKQSCDLDQPLRFFFDICQNENPCLNGGICQSLIPDYDNKYFSHTDTTEIHYECICPLHISGEHCQYLKYPFGYCINGGNLIEIADLNAKSKEKCSCPQGFEGDHCEDNIDDCINITCSNRGMCLDDINSYRCSCFDGFYGNQCEEKNVQMILLQVASKSFASVAILVIISIACLIIASDIHTYLTRKKQTKRYRRNKISRIVSELFENSVLLLGFRDAPIEMSDLSTIHIRRKSKKIKRHSINIRKAGYKKMSKGKYIETLQKPISKRYLLSNQTYQRI